MGENSHALLFLPFLCHGFRRAPRLNNFAGEFIILAGAFPIAPWAVAVGFFGVVLGLVYLVRLVQEVLFVRERQALPLPDLSLREGALLTVLAMMALYLGIHPGPVLELVQAPVQLLTAGGGP